MIEVLVASNNPVKLRAVENGFLRMFPGMRMDLQSVSVSSEVSEQPGSNEETLRGAINRAENAAMKFPEADYWVGVEGGIEEMGEEMIAFAWIVVKSGNRIGKGRTGTFFLPPAVAGLVRKGIELGEADDIVFRRSNSKQENGAVGILTDNVLDRTQLYEQAVILALVPFKNPALYP